MIGIIYKFTIIAKVKYNGNKPFYVGQHWCKSAEDFLCRDYPYYGSGKIWNDFINHLKQSNPNNWRCFIKREILCTVTNSSQKNLDKLEEFWIKREKAHYSYGVGGCNVLWGTPLRIGAGSPMKDPMVKERFSKSLKGKYTGDKSWNWGKSLSEEHAKKLHDAWRGKHHTKETKEKLSKQKRGKNNPMYGKPISEETRKKLSIIHKGRKLSEETRIKISRVKRGIKFSKEARLKMSRAKLGKHLTEETKLKMCKSQRERRKREKLK